MGIEGCARCGTFEFNIVFLTTLQTAILNDPFRNQTVAGSYMLGAIVFGLPCLHSRAWLVMNDRSTKTYAAV